MEDTAQSADVVDSTVAFACGAVCTCVAPSSPSPQDTWVCPLAQVHPVFIQSFPRQAWGHDLPCPTSPHTLSSGGHRDTSIHPPSSGVPMIWGKATAEGTWGSVCTDACWAARHHPAPLVPSRRQRVARPGDILLPTCGSLADQGQSLHLVYR